MRRLLFLKILPRKSPQDTSQTCEEKSCTSCVKDISGDIPNNDIENVVESTEKLFYEVSTLRDSPDELRMELHDALDTLCYAQSTLDLQDPFRDYL